MGFHCVAQAGLKLLSLNIYPPWPPKVLNLFLMLFSPAFRYKVIKHKKLLKVGGYWLFHVIFLVIAIVNFIVLPSF